MPDQGLSTEGGLLSSWIHIHERIAPANLEPDDDCNLLADVVDAYEQDDLACRIFKILGAMADHMLWVMGRKNSLSLSSSKNNNGTRVWMYRPRWIHVPTSDKTFQEDHIFIACGQAPDPENDGDFLANLLENLRTDEFTSNKEGHWAVRHEGIASGLVKEHEGAVRMWSENSPRAHGVNIEVFSMGIPYHTSKTWSTVPSELLPGEAEWVVQLELYEHARTKYTVLKQKGDQSWSLDVWK